MDSETQGLVNRLEEKLDRRFDQLEIKLDRHTEMIHAQDVRIVSAAARAEAAHIRIDSHKSDHAETRKWFGALWIGVILAWGKIVWDMFTSAPKGGGH